MLCITRPGMKLWKELPDPTKLILAVAFDGADSAELAIARPTQSEDDIWRANLDCTKHLIAAARADAPQVRFVMVSTELVYGADASHPGLEGDATNPKLAYPASKIAAENELRNSGLHRPPLVTL
jgi:UDP-glucose 4-epimerase